MEYQIDKAVPIPSTGFRTAPRRSKYPFHEMEVGDSFEHFVEEGAGRKAALQLSSVYSKIKGKKFSTRTTSPTSARCWRVE